MRIQHNIPAMNSYRNYTTNNSLLNKNLEKLSSGYKVNRAGDDAAGLAISEKMRAQITGLEGATKNAKDGISLIQTAEGALTEVHSMLNRMTTLSEQSANGTYDNTVDRAQLQKEIESLKSEIDRIADSSNFNGLKLLDGSLAANGGGVANGGKTALLEVTDTMKAAAGGSGNLAGLGALIQNAAATYAASLSEAGITVALGKSGVFTINYKDADGVSQTLNITVNVGTAAGDPTTYSINGGETKKVSVAAAAGGVTKEAMGTVLKEILTDEIGDIFDVDNAADKLSFTAKETGATKAEILSFSRIVDGDTGATYIAPSDVTEGADAYLELDAAKLKVWSDVDGTTNEEEIVFQVDGKKFAFVKTGEMTAAGKALGDDVNLIEIATGTAPATADATAMAKLINSKIGYDGVTTNNAHLVFKPTLGGGGAAGKGGLVLQIGDTGDAYNKMTVSVRDMHTASLGISKIDISTQDGATSAMDLIKAAINMVSDTRGGLGALQNRLDHTIQNLGVMRENIQNAESLIRDTDVAEEMMSYTKNSILNQSAQAMLAQANQLPQGVLQLLQ